MKVSAYSGSDFVNGKVNEDTFILSLAAEKTSKDELEFVGSLLGNEIKERLASIFRRLSEEILAKSFKSFEVYPELSDRI